MRLTIVRLLVVDETVRSRLQEVYYLNLTFLKSLAHISMPHTMAALHLPSLVISLKHTARLVCLGAKKRMEKE